MSLHSLAFLICLCLVAMEAAAAAQTTVDQRTRALKRLSLEELAELDITTLSRRLERLSHAAAAVSVVTSEDIRRSGATHLAEAMRLADALDVARADGRTWAISARGFNITTANKLLVMIDGRTVYSPLFGGTFWDVQDTLLHDVDRIEVIRGPGGTIWGANAVNGVVNVITRPAAETRGTFAQLIAGTEERFIGSVRHGGEAFGEGSYRLYGKFRVRDENRFTNGEPSEDRMVFGQGGFRLESAAAARTPWSLQGDLYSGREALVQRDDTVVSGGNALGRVSRRFGPTAEFRLQAYFDSVYRRMPLTFEEWLNTGDLDLQQHLQLGARHALLLGGGLRVARADDTGSPMFAFDPRVRTTWLLNTFVQDEIRLREELFLTLGAKFERNNFTGLETQPAARVRWSRTAHETVWGAVSRAVRLPTRFDTDLRLLEPATGAVTLTGSPHFEPERVVAFEAGYRVRPRPGLILDVAAFANRYDDLRSQEPVDGLVVLANHLNARTRGLEVTGTLQPVDRWRLHGSYSYLHKSLFLDPVSRDPTGGRLEGNDPAYLLSLRSYLDLPAHVALDGVFRHVPERPFPVVPSYSQLDLRLGWSPAPQWELSLVGQNLLRPRHPEFGAPGPRRLQFQRGVFLRSAWRF